jgi:hypothetical protein
VPYETSQIAIVYRRLCALLHGYGISAGVQLQRAIDNGRGVAAVYGGV